MSFDCDDSDSKGFFHQSVPILKIRTDGGTQIRIKRDEKTVEEYLGRMRAGDRFDPVILFNDDANLWAADGLHRIEAARRGGMDLPLAQRAGFPAIEAIIHQGTLRDAILYACGANTDHGLQRSQKDKRNAVLILLRDGEWGTKSDNWIAEKAKVDHKTVARLRASDLGIPKSTIRQTKGGRIIDTSNIGKGKREEAAAGCGLPPTAPAVSLSCPTPRHREVGERLTTRWTSLTEEQLAALEAILAA